MTPYVNTSNAYKFSLIIYGNLHCKTVQNKNTGAFLAQRRVIQTYVRCSQSQYFAPSKRTRFYFLNFGTVTLEVTQVINKSSPDIKHSILIHTTLPTHRNLYSWKTSFLVPSVTLLASIHFLCLLGTLQRYQQ